MKKIIVAAACLVTGFFMSGQSVMLSQVTNDIYLLNRVFDSSRYLGFHVNILYSSDTLLGQSEHEEMSGKYILNNRNVYYQMGNTEYVQNDSFVYNIYHAEKMMVMTRDIISARSKLFPLREFFDSVLSIYDTAYYITKRYVDNSTAIEFVARHDNGNLPYKRFAIYFDSSTHYPDRFEMDYTGSPNSSDEEASGSRKKHISMSFFDYYSPEIEVFKDDNYVHFDRARKKYLVTEKFRDYRFLVNGPEGDEDGSNEMAPPGN